MPVGGSSQSMPQVLNSVEHGSFLLKLSQCQALWALQCQWPAFVPPENPCSLRSCAAPRRDRG